MKKSHPTKYNKSKCPFCGGSKIKPFMGNRSQDCYECDKDGFIKNSTLRDLGLHDFIEKAIITLKHNIS